MFYSNLHLSKYVTLPLNVNYLKNSYSITFRKKKDINVISGKESHKHAVIIIKTVMLKGSVISHTSSKNYLLPLFNV